MLRLTQQQELTDADPAPPDTAEATSEVTVETLTELADELRATNKRLEIAQRQLHQLATTDPLTGCHNRRFFDEIIAHEVQRHHRYGIPLTCIFIDVDRFKTVNDCLGHAMGDRLVQHLAHLLKRHVRCADYVFRWGGDEFVVLMSCPEGEAQRKAATIKSAFGASLRRWALPPGVGLSIGVAELGRSGADIEALLIEADTRMYADKKANRRPALEAGTEPRFVEPDASVA